MSTTTTTPPSPLRAGLRSGDSAALLERIDARLERIEARLAKLDPLLDAAPGLISMAGDTFDELAAELGDADERVRGALRLLEHATRPEVLAQLEAGLGLLEQVPGLVSMVGDSFDEFAREAAEQGVEIDRLVPELGRALHAVLALLTDAQVRHLLDSDLLLPGAVEALGTAARALATTQHVQPEPRGLFATLSALRDPAVQRAMGFAIDVARRFGANLERPALPASTPGHES